MWQTWLAGGGLTAIVTGAYWLLYRYHKDALDAKDKAISSEQRRADDWRAAWEASERRATVREAQISTLLTGVREPA